MMMVDEGGHHVNDDGSEKEGKGREVGTSLLLQRVEGTIMGLSG